MKTRTKEKYAFKEKGPTWKKEPVGLHVRADRRKREGN